MTAQSLRAYWRALPFTPFRLHLASGRRLDVPHPDYAFVTPTGRYFFLYRDDDSHEQVDIRLINSVELLPRQRRRSKTRT
jgi:hypothetical protein